MSSPFSPNANGATIRIAASYSQAIAESKRLAAESPQGVAGITVTTFRSWIADLWELWGDGRAIAPVALRELLLEKILREETRIDYHGPGGVNDAARTVHDGSGIPSFERALKAAHEQAVGMTPDEPNPLAPLLPQEIALLECLAAYRDNLVELGCIEEGEALAFLAAQQDLLFERGTQLHLGQGVVPTPQQAAFLEACDNLDVVFANAEDAQRIKPVHESIELRFDFPSGSYARDRLLLERINQALDEGAHAIGIACAEPAETYNALASFVSQNAASCVLREIRDFAGTAFGKAFLTLHEAFATEGRIDIAGLADFLSSPYSDFSLNRAREIEKSLVGNRTFDAFELLENMRQESETFAWMETIAKSIEASDEFDRIAEFAMRRFASENPARRQAEIEAIAGVGDIYRFARALGQELDSCLSLIERIRIPYCVETPACEPETPSAADEAAQPVQESLQATPSKTPSVTIAVQNLIASMEPESLDVLIVADLSSESYPVSSRETSGTALLEKLGIAPVESKMQRARRTFNALTALPARRLVLSRPLSDSDGNESYAAAVLEEFVDCYREDPSATEDIDNLYRLPKQLQEGSLKRGEDHLHANAAVSEAPAPGPTILVHEPWKLSAEAREMVLATKTLDTGEHILSPTQIETYLDCPLKWFAERRLGISAIEETFDARGIGNFAHSALERFYRRLQEETGVLKLTKGILETSKFTMEEVLDELRKEQLKMKPAEGRLVPLSQGELRKIDECCRQIMGFLEYETQLLPMFHPAHLEYTIDSEDAFLYGGCAIVGTIDRIDVDGQNRGIVLDYKGHAGKSYECSGTGPEAPGKIQALIYAQAARKLLKLDMVGALYVSYGKRHSLAGAYDHRILDSQHLPAMRTDRCWFSETDYDAASFNDLLDAVETRVSVAVDAMKDGLIAPHPQSSESCRYCTVASCDRRM